MPFVMANQSLNNLSVISLSHRYFTNLFEYLHLIEVRNSCYLLLCGLGADCVNFILQFVDYIIFRLFKVQQLLFLIFQILSKLFNLVYQVYDLFIQVRWEGGNHRLLTGVFWIGFLNIWFNLVWVTL